jgi:hypothetical protein
VLDTALLPTDLRDVPVQALAFMYDLTSIHEAWNHAFRAAPHRIRQESLDIPAFTPITFLMESLAVSAHSMSRLDLEISN